MITFEEAKTTALTRNPRYNFYNEYETCYAFYEKDNSNAPEDTRAKPIIVLKVNGKVLPEYYAPKNNLFETCLSLGYLDETTQEEYVRSTEEALRKDLTDIISIHGQNSLCGGLWTYLEAESRPLD